MKRKKHHYFANRHALNALFLFPAAATPVFAQQKPFMEAGTAQPPPPLSRVTAPASAGTETNAVVAPEPNPLDKFFNHQIPNVIAQGKFNLNVRLRYEQADEDGVAAVTKNSYAPTIRTRFGYTTAPLYGFQARLEGVNVSVLGPGHNYNAAGSNGQGARPVVGDPPLTRLDQAWLAYRYTNWISAKAGQQRIVLDNQRFIGDSAWRQNMQTFDAASVTSEPVAGVDLYYGYIWDVHRVYGDVSGLPAANTDFDSRSHLINVSYSGWKYGRFAGYAYLLDLHNASGDANSCATYGGYFAGAAPVTDWLSVDYRAEFAWQDEYADSPLRYSADYYNLEAGASIKPVAFGAGCEDLGSGVNSGSGGGRASFRTPLATLHPFNGWADVFLTTPANGLRDLYAYFQLTLPAQIPVRFVFHQYNPDYGSGNYGQEYDVVASKKFGKNWTVLAKFADYEGEDAPAPSLAVPNVRIQRVWAQVEFNF
ncbi:MAG TPA: hypothetical protein VG077_05450 [Verrucomicrobiae bacterium]|nr:hypothetical protein [Verrucomicrobiae bacterium]